MKKIEEDLHIAICNYIKLQYPKVFFMSDASGLRMPIGLAVKFHKMHSSHSQLDIIVLHPSKSFNGLVMEVKRGLNEVFKNNGEYRNSKHVIEQNKSIEHLTDLGYMVQYVFSFDEAKELIDEYLN